MMAALVILAAACALAAIATATVLAICALSGRLSRAEEDQALGVANSGARTPPAAGKAAPAPQASQPPGLAAPPPGHQPRCALCGWHRTWRDCCGWGWVAEICPAHERRKATP